MAADTQPRWWLIDWNSIHNNQYTSVVTILSAMIIFYTCYQLLMKKSSRNKAPLPPGPRGLPIVGSLPFLDPNLHAYLAKLSVTYGPIFKLQLGGKLCIVLSSPSVIEEVQKFHDIIFSNRDPTAVGLALTYGGMDIGYTPYGQQWRMLRKICVKELLTSKRLDCLQALRRKEVRGMVNNIYSNIEKPVDLRGCMVIVMFNLLTTTLWGSNTLGKVDRDRITIEFGELLHQLNLVLGAPNVSDFFPILAKFDLQGLERKMKKVHLWLDRILDFVINERLKSKQEGKVNSNSEEKDFLEVLLQIKDEGGETSPFTMIHVKSLLIDMLLGGNKTISTTIEWTMAELMNHPETMKKVQDEIEEVVGMDNIVEESHIPKFEYLNAVVKEALRLHPPGPLAIPRITSAPCVVAGYSVPKGAKVIVNIWAIQKDADHWDNPLEFKPERFLNAGNNYDYNGVNSSYIPFGFGRRICFGIPLVERLVPYIIASLLHSFDWRMPEGEELDLSETFGIELTKTIPLVAVLKPRLSESKLYT